MTAHMSFRHSKKTQNLTFSCDICDDDFNTKSNLTNHIKNEHAESSQFNCTDCEEHFSDNWNLMNHRRDEHIVTEVCPHFLKKSCKFPNGQCWLKHEKSNSTKSSEVKNIKCYTCKKDFKTKNGMMLHRKKYHPEATSKCEKYQNGGCTFDEFECWYIHYSRREVSESSEEIDSSETENVQQGFQNAQRKTVPPNQRK